MQTSPVVLVMAFMKVELGESSVGMGTYDLLPLWIPVLIQAGENHILSSQLVSSHCCDEIRTAFWTRVDHCIPKGRILS